MTSEAAVSESLFSFLDSHSTASNASGPVIIFTHRQADPDALCSAFALSQYLGASHGKSAGSTDAVRRNVRLVAPQGSSLLGASVCKVLDIPFTIDIESSDIASASLIAAVDVGDTGLLEPFLTRIRESMATKILIDHHSFSRDQTDQGGKVGPYDSSFVDGEATSTCEILALGYPAESLDTKTARALLVGILFDSQHLGIATSRTLRGVLKLLDAGARMDESKEALRQRPDRSETFARLKAAQRMTFSEIGHYLVAQSEVSSFQAAAARMLVEVGSDVAIAFGKQEDEARVSVRTSQRFFRETGIDMGVLLGNLSTRMTLSGGGHPTAASISGNRPPGEIVREIVGEMKAKLEIPKT